MAPPISHTAPQATIPLHLAQRALRTLGLVATCWMFAGCALAFWPVTTITPLIHRLHILGLSCLVVAGALYSVLLPLTATLRRHTRETT